MTFLFHLTSSGTASPATILVPNLVFEYLRFLLLLIWIRQLIWTSDTISPWIRYWPSYSFVSDNF